MVGTVAKEVDMEAAAGSQLVAKVAAVRTGTGAAAATVEVVRIREATVEEGGTECGSSMSQGR